MYSETGDCTELQPPVLSSGLYEGAMSPCWNGQVFLKFSN
jgi:hypothetical protein